MLAERVTPEAARKVALTFFSNNGVKAIQLTDCSKDAGFPNLYIFNAEPGFVVMAADDCVQPILGYSLTNPFVTEGLPENISFWLQGYNDEIQSAIDHQVKASYKTAQQWKALLDGNPTAAKATTVVEPLIQTKWDQGSPYNNLCPSGYVTGCIATSMAQVMKYWNYPSHGIGSHSYMWNGEILSADFGESTYDWENMTNTYGSNSTDLQKNAVATLMFHCGVSVDMNYGPNSGATPESVPVALINYFNYSSETHLLYRANYSDENEWISMLKAELDQNRPIWYRGTGSSGGHAFVCDGYNDADFFHFNWGWSGNCDDYYTINNLYPGPGGIGSGAYGIFNDGQAALFGLQPGIEGSAEAPVLTANLIQDTGVRDAQLNWNVVPNATAYQVYRNGALIHTTDSGTETSYLDVHIAYGTTTYYVRSVDTNGHLSWPSNYASVTIIFAAPTNLIAEQVERSVQLSWNPCEGAESYNVYCNNCLIGNIDQTSYNDIRTIAGNLDYFVRGVDSFGDESESSNHASLSVPYSTPIVENLEASISEDAVVLSWATPSWCYPITPTATLTYGNGNYLGKALGYNNGVSRMYWGHRYPTSNISAYDNMYIYKVSFYANETGFFKVFIYQGTTSNHPLNLVMQQTVLVEAEGWVNIDLSNAPQIDASQDLWVFMFDPEARSFPGTYCSYSGGEGNYYSTNPTSLVYTFSGIAFLIKTFVSDGNYTYNLYQDGSIIAENLTETSYNASLNENAANLFMVKANYYGGETQASNKIGFAKGNALLPSFNMAANDKMTVMEDSKLTVSETLSNENTANLILENDAQLVNNSNGVQATVKKNISAYTQDGGWYLIASPITEDITPSTNCGLLTNNYDLYTFNQSEEMEWRNYKAQNFNISNKTGYLYANSGNTMLSFAGTLVANTTATTLAYDNNATFKGFNLIGNPYPCNTYISGRSFYVIQEGDNGSEFVLGSNPIPPCAAILVQAQGSGESVTFSKTASKNEPNIAISVTKADMRGEAIIDQARVSFNEKDQLTKYTLNEHSSKLYIPQNGQDFAVAFADNQTEIPVNYKATKNGIYTISIETDNLELDYLHLIDNMTGTDVDLLTKPSYTFEAKTTDYASRFRLMFNANTTGEPSTDLGAFAYISDGNIIVNNEGEAMLQIIDMTGRIIVCRDGVHTVSTSEMVPGVYVLRLIDGENVRTQKITIE